MKIVDICLCSSYNIGWGYQDNLISKYHLKNGNEVSIITSSFINDKNSEDYLSVEPGIYEDYGVKVIRLKNGFSRNLTKLFRHYKGLYKTLISEKPDFIFIHNCQFVDMFFVCKYLKKHPTVNCVVDGHADYTNSAQSKFAYFVHKTLWKTCAQKINKYAEKFYGVLPLRCDFIHEMYGIDNSKIDLLVMGADDELLDKGLKNIKETRKKYNLNDEDFVILTGGKIDYHKTETLLLMKAVNELNNKKVKLFIFGSVAEKIQDDFNKLLSENIIFTGWLNQQDVYDVICASDIGFFPGRHSVIWEQMVASGTPCVFRKIAKTDHVDIGGNCLFIDDVTFYGIKNMLNYIVDNDNYCNLKQKAMSEKKKDFLYSQIAKKSVETMNAK